MDNFNKQLINAVKIFEASSEELDDEKISFLRYCFKNIESKDSDDLVICNEIFESIGASLDGYFYDEDSDSYLIFETIYNDELEDDVEIDAVDFYFHLKRIKEIIKKSSDGTFDDFDATSKTYDICSELNDAVKKDSDIIINIYSNYVIPENMKDIDGQGFLYDCRGNKINVYYKIYDLIDLKEKLDQLSKDNIEMNCYEKFGCNIPALRISSTLDFDVYMCSMKGNWLAKLYKEDGVRLLEPNVRSYLKRTSKTNSGIFETIKVCPENFVTYNNGLSAVATNIEFEQDGNANLSISSLFNFQIVNGGQTTATLAEALKEPSIRDNLKDIIVPVKLTVVKNLSNSSRLIGDISVYSNTQTAIKKSDPPSNLPFYISIKKLSNEVISNENGVNYICYFERTAGEYDTELRRNNSTKTFSKANPSNKKFTKIELANAINAWEQLPYVVCLGKEKSFAQFNLEIKNQFFEPDNNYFKKAYALIILMKYLDKRAKKLGLTYKSNVIAYSMSYLSKLTNKRLDLLQIWEEKAIPNYLVFLIDDILDLIHHVILEAPSNCPEPRMWARKEACWNKITYIHLDMENIPLVEDENTFFAPNEHLAFIKNDDNFFNPSIWTKLILWNDKYKILNKAQLNAVKTVRTICSNRECPLTKKQRSYAEEIFLIAVKNKFNY